MDFNYHIRPVGVVQEWSQFGPNDVIAWWGIASDAKDSMNHPSCSAIDRR